MFRGRRAAGLVAVGLLMGMTSTAAADTYVVDRTGDDAGAGLCTPLPDNCSLRSAINLANGSVAVDDTITIPAGTFQTTSALPAVTDQVTITGAGPGQTVIDGGNDHALLTLDSSELMDVNGLTLRNAGGAGSDGSLTVQDGRPARLTDVAIVDNALAGVLLDSGTLVATRVLVARNVGRGVGGVLVQGANTFLLGSNLTIADNRALAADAVGTPIALAGGLVTVGATVLTDSTISGNRVDPTAAALGADNLTQVGPVASGFSLLRIANSIVANAQHTNCQGDITSGGANVATDHTCGLGDAPGDLVVDDAKLGPLAGNGGPLQTIALLEGSPAVDVGGTCAATDARGSARPQGGGCDAGAFESPFTKPPPKPTPAATTTVTVTSTAPGVTAQAPAPDTTPAKVTVSGVGRTVTRSALNKGLKLSISSNEPVSVEATLLVSPRIVKIARSYDLSVGSAGLKRGSGRRSLVIKPKKRITGKRRVSALVKVVAIDAGGNRTTVTKAFSVR